MSEASTFGIDSAELRKARGTFFTPPKVTEFIAEWASGLRAHSSSPGSHGRSGTETASRYRSGMDYSFTAPTAAEFGALYDETGWADWSLDRFERALSGSWVVCTARDDAGRLIGMGRLISDGALHAFVTEMIVTEHARGAGVGGEIITRLVEESRRRGVDDVQLFAARGRAAFSERHAFGRRPETGPGMDVTSVH